MYTYVICIHIHAHLWTQVHRGKAPATQRPLFGACLIYTCIHICLISMCIYICMHTYIHIHRHYYDDIYSEETLQLHEEHLLACQERLGGDSQKSCSSEHHMRSLQSWRLRMRVEYMPPIRVYAANFQNVRPTSIHLWMLVVRTFCGSLSTICTWDVRLVRGTDMVLVRDLVWFQLRLVVHWKFSELERN